MSLTLEVPEFDAIGGIVRTVAVSNDAGEIEVTVIAGTESVVAIARRMVHGRIDAFLNGTPIRMNHFSMLNQPNQLRLHMTIQFELRGASDRLAPLDL